MEKEIFIVALGADLELLEHEVNLYLNNGYKLYGGISQIKEEVDGKECKFLIQSLVLKSYNS